MRASSIKRYILSLQCLCVCWTRIRAQGGSNIYPLAQSISPDDLQAQMDLLVNAPKRAESEGARDCSEILDENPLAPSGVYTIYPPTCVMCYFHVWCDMTKEGGGWTVIMRRNNGTVDSYRGNWFYKFGFGDVNGEYYIGNQRIHDLTIFKPMEMKICLTDVGDVESVAGYSHFYLEDMMADFVLHYDSYYGDAGDYLNPSNNTKFSTFDNDLDGAPQNCPQYFHSAWWYHTYGNSCGSQSNLFGYYFLGKKELPHFAGPGISWKPVPGPGGPAIKEVVMKIRPMGYIGGSKDFPPGNTGVGGSSTRTKASKTT